MPDVPRGASVRVSAPESETIDQAVGFVTGVAGDETKEHDRVPEGYVEVTFRFVDPQHLPGVRHVELFEVESQIVEVFC